MSRGRELGGLVAGLLSVAALELVRGRARGCPGVCSDVPGLLLAAAPLGLGVAIARGKPEAGTMARGLAIAGTVAVTARVIFADELELAARRYVAELDAALDPQPDAPVVIVNA